MTNPESRADQAHQDALDLSRRLAHEGSSVLHQTEPPEEEWDAFCDAFSESHRGWIVTLRSVDTELLETDPTRAFEEGRVLVRGEVLSDVRLVQENGGVHIDLRVGEGPGGGAHIVEQPVRLMVKRTHEGADAGLRVDAQDGHSALLLFRVPARPAELDGIAPAELEQDSRTVIPLREGPDQEVGRGGSDEGDETR